jgi:hypothetical protein
VEDFVVALDQNISLMESIARADASILDKLGYNNNSLRYFKIIFYR